MSFTRRFRPLATRRGLPVVIIAAHPPKQAGDDNLLPYGGGGTLNEVDGNFTLRLDENGLYAFHWQGKIRGLPFDPLHFKIERMDSPDVVTIEGERVKMPVMFPIADADVEARQEAFAGRDLALLKAIAADPMGSERKWSTATNINRRAVQSALNALKRDRLVTLKLKRWRLTKEGERIAKEGEPSPERPPEPAPKSTPETAVKKAPKKDRANDGPDKPKTRRARTRASKAPTIPGETNV